MLSCVEGGNPKWPKSKTRCPITCLHCCSRRCQAHHTALVGKGKKGTEPFLAFCFFKNSFYPKEEGGNVEEKRRAAQS